MRIDLQQVDAEITALRSRLAAIDDDLDECRLRYFQYPWAWSQIRRTLTFERHRVQRRLEQFTFARKCTGGQTRRSAAILSFRSLAGPGERSSEGERAPGSPQGDHSAPESVGQPAGSLGQLRVNSPASHGLEDPQAIFETPLDRPMLRVIQGGRI